MSRPDPRSDEGKARQEFYSTAAWKRARKYQLRTHPLCELCSTPGNPTAARVVNHRIPIEKRPDLRLDPDNLQSLCKVCHDGPTQSFEKTGVQRGCDRAGIPNDPRSHWHV